MSLSAMVCRSSLCHDRLAFRERIAMNRPSALPPAVIGLLLAAGSLHAATFRVGTGGGCTHATVSAAIASAAGTPEVDFIRITRSGSHDDTALTINNQHLILDGGYATCTAGSSDGLRTTLNGNGDDSVLEIRGNADVVLSNLTITGGHEPRFDYGYGGGIQISGGPHLVSLNNVVVTGNDAGHGGGISVKNDFSGNPNDVKLILNDDVVVSLNEAGFASGASLIQGGGIYCKEASVQMIGGGSTSIAFNTAQHDGGGIGAEQCDLTIAPRGGLLNGLAQNTAGRDGGGLAVEGFSGGGTRFYTTDAARPVFVFGNSAGREGGGIKVNAGAEVKAWDLIIDGNRSYDEGGGVSVYDDGGDVEVQFTMRGDLAGAPAGAVNCLADKRCNRISGNLAQAEDGAPKQAAALRMKMNEADLEARLIGTLVTDNVGANVFRLRADCGALPIEQATLVLDGVLIAGNAVNGEIALSPDAPFDCYTDLRIVASTIAGNIISGSDVIRSNSSISLARDIIWQPGKRALNASGVDAGRVQYTLASDLTGFPASTSNFSADPRFMDAEHGDFHLHPSSPAVDYTPANDPDEWPYFPEPDDAEADGLARALNLALVPDADGFGAQDLGAYERQSIGNLSRNGTFDEDLRLWQAVDGTSTWNSSDVSGAAGSGSIRISDTAINQGFTGARQCVGIPGPALYELWGYGRVDNGSDAYPDAAILSWRLHLDSADCNGTVIAGSGDDEIRLPGWQPFNSQFINVAPAQWTPNTSIEIRLGVIKNIDTGAPDYNGLARFDLIRLTQAGDLIFADGFQ